MQWELLETFERRLRSFRAGFRFEWSPSFRVGVAALDDQHRTLFALVNTLCEAIGRTGVLEGHERRSAPSWNSPAGILRRKRLS